MSHNPFLRSQTCCLEKRLHCVQSELIFLLTPPPFFFPAIKYFTRRQQDAENSPQLQTQGEADTLMLDE